jgi:hypothetical protein
MVAGREPVHVADLAQDPSGEQRADPDHVDQPRPGGRDQLGELGQARGELLVELLQPYDPALRELRAHGAGPGLLEELGRGVQRVGRAEGTAVPRGAGAHDRQVRVQPVGLGGALPRRARRGRRCAP